MAVADGRRQVTDTGVWVVYYDDFSGFAVFSSEIAALRYAVSRTMQIAQVAFGEDVREQLR